MGANVGNWTAKYYGRRLTPAEFLANSAAQDAVVNGALGGYFKKYGPSGAAAMWYSGQSDPSKTYGNPPVYKYVQQVMDRAGTYSGGSGGMTGTSSAVGGGGGTGSTAVTPKLSTDELAAQYGLSAALINSNKELKSLFGKAVSGSWTADLFTAKLKNTNWWKLQPDTLRTYITERFTDPATWRQKNQAAQASINALAVQVGLGSQIYTTGKFAGGANPLLKQAIYNSVALGWTDARIKDWLGSKVAVHGGGTMWGEAGTALDQIHSTAYLNGMRYTGWAVGMARGIASGKDTLEHAEAVIRAQAAAKYSAFADQIKAGQNLSDLASPYIQSVAKILELPSTDVDVFNSHVSQAMTSNTKGQAMSIWEFEQSLRKDPLWKKTQNAQDSAMSTAHQVLTQFGMVY